MAMSNTMSCRDRTEGEGRMQNRGIESHTEGLAAPEEEHRNGYSMTGGREWGATESRSARSSGGGGGGGGGGPTR